MTERGAQHGDAATEILGNALRLYSDALHQDEEALP